SSSTNWANRRAGRSHSAPATGSAEYVTSRQGAPRATPSASVTSMGTSTALSAMAGVMSVTRPASGSPAAAPTGFGPEPPSAVSSNSPDPEAVIVESAPGAYSSADHVVPSWSVNRNPGPTSTASSPFT